MRPTLVSIHHHEFSGRQFFHGDEIPPGVLEGELLGYWVDHGWAREMPERRSLHRLLHIFSGCKETEELDGHELRAYSLPK
jgi:hypothetical protein